MRVRKYRAAKGDLGAAVHLKLDEGDDDDLNDSVFSGSTNVTNSADNSQQEARTFSRQSSKGDVIEQADSVITEGGESDRVSFP